MSRLSADDWLAAGFDVLAREGAGALTIDRLTAALGVTKGSFYHHFSSCDDFRLRILGYWEKRLTSDVIAEAETASSSERVLDMFVDALTKNPPDAERAIRAWALEDDDVRRHLEGIDAMRLEQATMWFRQGMTEADARTAARTMHALLVGCYSVLPPVGNAELKHIMAEFFARYGARPRR